MTSKAGSVARRALDLRTEDCARDLVFSIHTSALLTFAYERNSALRTQQELSAHLLEQYAASDSSGQGTHTGSSCRAMNVLPSYAGALETTYMLLFPRMNDEEVVSFLLACKWVSPMIANQERLVNDGASIPLGRFLSESMAIVSAVRYAELYDEHPITAIPAQADYVQMAYKLARKSPAKRYHKDARRYASLLSLPYMILVSDKEVARSFVTKENFAEQLDLVLEIMNRWRHSISLPLRQTVEQLTPIYYSGFIRVPQSIHPRKRACGRSAWR
ncbi:MAG: hypothetical protein IPH00_16110 [Flavobacteriales bacterium]|nr:hypothetical protein [Flavobacteriales bacterium]